MPVIVNMTITSIYVMGPSSIMVVFSDPVCLNDVGSGSNYSMDDYSISALNSENWELYDADYSYSIADVQKVTNRDNAVVIQFSKSLEHDITYYLYPSSNILSSDQSKQMATTPQSFIGEYVKNSPSDKLGKRVFQFNNRSDYRKIAKPGLIVDSKGFIDFFSFGMDKRRSIIRRIYFAKGSLYHDQKFGAGLRSKSLMPPSAYEVKRLVSEQVELDGSYKDYNVSVTSSSEHIKININGKLSNGVDMSTVFESGVNADYGLANNS